MAEVDLSKLAWTEEECDCLTAALLAGDKAEAKKELHALVKDLKQRDVKQPVLDEIEAYTESL